MRITPSESRDMLTATLVHEAYAICAMGFVFWLPLEKAVQALACALVLLFVLSVERLQAAITYERLSSSQNQWLEQLCLRFALNDMFQKLKIGQGQEIDWETATKDAVKDIKSHDTQLKSADELGSGKAIHILLVMLFVPGLMIFRVGAALALAKLGAYFLHADHFSF